jgi:hypothetical protein
MKEENQEMTIALSSESFDPPLIPPATHLAFLRF